MRFASWTAAMKPAAQHTPLGARPDPPCPAAPQSPAAPPRNVLGQLLGRVLNVRPHLRVNGVHERLVLQFAGTAGAGSMLLGAAARPELLQP